MGEDIEESLLADGRHSYVPSAGRGGRRERGARAVQSTPPRRISKLHRTTRGALRSNARQVDCSRPRRNHGLCCRHNDNSEPYTHGNISFYRRTTVSGRTQPSTLLQCGCCRLRCREAAGCVRDPLSRDWRGRRRRPATLSFLIPTPDYSRDAHAVHLLVRLLDDHIRHGHQPVDEP